MITEAEGNLLDAPVDALVNTVNTVGVMGKGIALQFKHAYPENFKEYPPHARPARCGSGTCSSLPPGGCSRPRSSSTSRPRGTGSRDRGSPTSTRVCVTYDACSRNSRSHRSQSRAWDAVWVA